MYDKMHIVSVTLRYTVCRNHNQLAPPTHKRRRHVRHHRLLHASIRTHPPRSARFGQLPLTCCPFRAIAPARKNKHESNNNCKNLPSRCAILIAAEQQGRCFSAWRARSQRAQGYGLDAQLSVPLLASLTRWLAALT